MIMEYRKYVIKLINCGYSIQDAEYTVFDFLKNYGKAELNEFIESLEKDYALCG